jgi:Protein of unknown function (DUF4233)
MGAAVRRLCATVLIMETVVFWLAIPVALAVEHAAPRKAGVAGVVLAVAAVVLAALARRRLRWTLVGGSVLQVLVIAAGAIVPVMYFLGAIFAALWVIGIILGYRVDQSGDGDAVASGTPSAQERVSQAPAASQGRAGDRGRAAE